MINFVRFLEIVTTTKLDTFVIKIFDLKFYPAHFYQIQNKLVSKLLGE
jgi:hypothetical protein